jgi:hypothetical protein
MPLCGLRNAGKQPSVRERAQTCTPAFTDEPTPGNATWTMMRESGQTRAYGVTFCRG